MEWLHSKRLRQVSISSMVIKTNKQTRALSVDNIYSKHSPRQGDPLACCTLPQISMVVAVVISSGQGNPDETLQRHTSQQIAQFGGKMTFNGM